MRIKRKENLPRKYMQACIEYLSRMEFLLKGNMDDLVKVGKSDLQKSEVLHRDLQRIASKMGKTFHDRNVVASMKVISSHAFKKVGM